MALLRRVSRLLARCDGRLCSDSGRLQHPQVSGKSWPKMRVCLFRPSRKIAGRIDGRREGPATKAFRAAGSAFSMIWSHCGFQGVPPSSTFFSSIGVGGAGLVAWAREAVAIPMKNTRPTMNAVFSADVLMFTGLACRVLPASTTLDVTPSCGLSLPSFARRVAFSELLPQFFSLGCGFNRRWQFQLGLFRRAMVAMVQRPDARSLFVHPQLSISKFSALVFKVCRDRFSCHGPQCGRTIAVQAVQFWPVETIHGPRHDEVGGLRAAPIGRSPMPCSDVTSPNSSVTQKRLLGDS